MKKSLRQMVLVGLSTTLLASVAVAPVVWAQDDTSESSEQVEDPSEELPEESTEESSETSTEESSEENTDESSEESTEERSEESVEETTESTTEDTSTEVSEEVAEIEASLVQQGVEEALNIFQQEYPDAEIEEIDVELDRDDDDADEDEETTETEDVYQITINGFDAEDNSFELEIEWVNGDIREQAFNEGLFNTDASDSTDTTATDTETSVEEGTSESMSEESVEGDTLVDEETDDTNETQERRGLDLEVLISLDEAVEIATAEFGVGEITQWNLTVDDPDWYEFWEDGYENPIWTIDIENNTEEDQEDSEIRIDAVTGDIINLEDIDTPESIENSSDTESTSEESSE
ncbi:PepSY domain-containing protein [Fundicoccus sp. Sow4_F4]|uniref:PepSY domain-containing protein n=1 Tax=Fundicoccus sp. Sow4_F4 TaxID=3438783 RepID=UPI003F90EBF2